MATKGGTARVLDTSRGRRFEQRVRDAAVEMLAGARQAIERRGDIGDVETIHQLRVCTKRLRALLWLIRAQLPESTVTALNREAKTLADWLSGARDAQVALQTLQAVVDDAQGTEPAQRLFSLLQRNQPESSQTDLAPPDWSALQQHLEEMIQSWSTLASAEIQRKHLKQGLKRSFRRGRRDWKASREVTDVEPLHDWRKQVKRLLYQQQLLQQQPDKTGKRLKRLGDLLGQLHDIDMLDERLQQQRRYCWLEDLMWLRSRMQQQRQQYLVKALKLGRKIYADQSAKGYANSLVSG